MKRWRSSSRIWSYILFYHLYTIHWGRQEIILLIFMVVILMIILWSVSQDAAITVYGINFEEESDASTAVEILSRKIAASPGKSTRTQNLLDYLIIWSRSFARSISASIVILGYNICDFKTFCLFYSFGNQILSSSFRRISHRQTSRNTTPSSKNQNQFPNWYNWTKEPYFFRWVKSTIFFFIFFLWEGVWGTCGELAKGIWRVELGFKLEFFKFSGNLK